MLQEGNGPDLLIDGKFSGALNTLESKKQPSLANINQIIDAGFDQGIADWQYDPALPHGASTGMDMSEKWTLFNGHTLHIHQNAGFNNPVELVYHDPVEGPFLPVQANDFYQISGSFGLHRCHGALVLDLYDKNQKRVYRHDKNVVQGKRGGSVLEDYQTVCELIQIPHNVCYARIVVKKFPAKNGETDSFLFFTRPFFALLAAPEEPELKWEKSFLSLTQWQALRKMDLQNYAAIPFSLPELVYDGQRHLIELIEHGSGEAAIGSPKTFQLETDVDGQLAKLEGTRVIGWVSAPEVRVKLLIDGQWVADTVSASVADNGHYYFSVALPAAFLDGRAHRIEAKVRFSGKQVGELAEITPYTLTPWNVLQKFAGKPLPAKLSPAAAYRYDAMRASLLALSSAAQQQDEDGSHWAETVARVSSLGTLHELLVVGFDAIKKFVPLRFPSLSQPQVSVVVPVHNKFAVTYHCMAALLFAYNRASFEVILVDDGSSDETINIETWVSGIVYLRNETSQGFIRSCNRGAQAARGEYIVLLNNDTEPTVHWLDELLFVFAQFDRVGLAGSKLLYPDGSLQEAGGIVWASGNPWNYGRGGNASDPRFNYSRQVDYLSGAAIMLSKSVWQQVGGFSEAYCPAYFEDTDLAFKVREAGYKTVYAPLSVVYHFEGISSGTDVASGTKRYQEINRPKFKQKWIHACRYHGEEGKDVDLNKDRGISLRALVIDYQTPRPDIDAGSYAAIQEMRLLQSFGFKVTFVPENFAYLGKYTELLQRLGIEVLYAPFSLSMQSVLEKRGAEFDVVYITRYYVAKNQLDLVKQYAPKAKVLFCNADLHFLRELREAIEFKDKEKLKQACVIREEELGIMRNVDVVLSYNEVEHAVVLSHNLDSTKVVTCPWVVDVSDNTPGFAARDGIAFLGGFGHPPNKAAVLFFIHQVMPILQHQLPEATFHVFGSNIPEDLSQLSQKNLIIEGYVEDVADVYHRCRVFVAPLLTGAGIKGKVIEALAYGMPSVVTAIAAEGIPLRHGLEVLVAETAQEWADAVTELYTNPVLWEHVSKNAKAFARTRYSFDQGRQLMRKALEAAEVFTPIENQALVATHARPFV